MDNFLYISEIMINLLILIHILFNNKYLIHIVNSLKVITRWYIQGKTSKIDVLRVTGTCSLNLDLY